MAVERAPVQGKPERNLSGALSQKWIRASVVQKGHREAGRIRLDPSNEGVANSTAFSAGQSGRRFDRDMKFPKLAVHPVAEPLNDRREELPVVDLQYDLSAKARCPYARTHRAPSQPCRRSRPVSGGPDHVDRQATGRHLGELFDRAPLCGEEQHQSPCPHCIGRPLEIVAVPTRAEIRRAQQFRGRYPSAFRARIAGPRVEVDFQELLSAKPSVFIELTAIVFGSDHRD